MITKRNGNGQTECRGCKEKEKFALNWDSWLYNFNNEPYCFDCLMELLEDYHRRINKAIEIVEKYNLGKYDYSIPPVGIIELLEKLKGNL